MLGYRLICAGVYYELETGLGSAHGSQHLTVVMATQ